MQSTSCNLVLMQQQQQQQEEETQEPTNEGDQSASGKPFIWTTNNREGRIKREMDPFSTFKPLHESDSNWCINNYDGSSSSLHPNHFHNSQNNCESIMAAGHALTLGESSPLNPVDSSSDSVYAPESVRSPFPPKPYLSSFLNAIYNYPLDTSLDVLSDSSGFLGQLQESQALVSPGFTAVSGMSSQARPVDSDLGFVSQNSGALLLPWADDGDFNPFSLDAYGNPLFLNRGKAPKPLEIGSSPAGSNLTNTLFQRRLPSQSNSGKNKDKCKNPIEENFHVPVGFNLDKGKGLADEEHEVLKKRKKHRNAEAEVEEMKRSCLDSSNSEEQIENYFIGENASHGLEIPNANSSVINGNEKGKKGRLPAKNLMAERRRRKKLNDRLYMLRSVVPKISKMDRASILADAIEYLRELLDKIKLLNDELQSMPVAHSLPTHTSPLPPTPSGPSWSHPFKEEVCKSSPSNVVNQLPMVHVEEREDNAFNIHMFCTRRPGLLLSTIRALDGLGLDIQQAVISCFNGFALDIFRAENSNGGMELHQDQIKAALLDMAAFHGVI